MSPMGPRARTPVQSRKLCDPLRVGHRPRPRLGPSCPNPGRTLCCAPRINSHSRVSTLLTFASQRTMPHITNRRTQVCKIRNLDLEEHLQRSAAGEKPSPAGDAASAGGAAPEQGAQVRLPRLGSQALECDVCRTKHPVPFRRTSGCHMSDRN